MTTTEAPATVHTASVAAADFIRAFTNAALFACTDDTLPVLCAVRVYQPEGASGTVTFEATNRYVASQETVGFLHRAPAQDEPAPSPRTALDVKIDAKAGKQLAATIKRMINPATRSMTPYDRPKAVISWDGTSPTATVTLTDNLSPDVALPVVVTQGEFPKGIALFFAGHRTQGSLLCAVCHQPESAGNPNHDRTPAGDNPKAYEPHRFAAEDEPQPGKFQDWAISPAWLSALVKVVPAEAAGYGRGKPVTALDFSFGYAGKPVLVTIGEQFRAIVMPWRKAD